MYHLRALFLLCFFLLFRRVQALLFAADEGSISVGRLTLAANEEVRVEDGSVLAMLPNMALDTAAVGGLLKSLTRSVFGGEKFFMNTFRAPAAGGELLVAPPLPGDLEVISVENEALMVQSGSFVASEMGITLDTKWGGAKTFFASEGLIMLHASGRGKLLLSSYGAIHEMNLGAGQGYTVDTGHLVAFTEGMDFKVRPIGGVKSTLFSGEGLVVDLKGPGRALLQSRSTDAFISWLIPKLPQSNNSG